MENKKFIKISNQVMVMSGATRSEDKKSWIGGDAKLVAAAERIKNAKNERQVNLEIQGMLEIEGDASIKTIGGLPTNEVYSNLSNLVLDVKLNDILGEIPAFSKYEVRPDRTGSRAILETGIMESVGYDEDFALSDANPDKLEALEYAVHTQFKEKFLVPVFDDEIIERFTTGDSFLAFNNEQITKLMKSVQVFSFKFVLGKHVEEALKADASSIFKVHVMTAAEGAADNAFEKEYIKTIKNDLIEMEYFGTDYNAYGSGKTAVNDKMVASAKRGSINLQIKTTIQADLDEYYSKTYHKDIMDVRSLGLNDVELIPFQKAEKFTPGAGNVKGTWTAVSNRDKLVGVLLHKDKLQHNVSVNGSFNKAYPENKKIIFGHHFWGKVWHSKGHVGSILKVA